ncbi:hypothetical protein L6452_20845 [Arctium lappa]|uniref:Uncharacterized protein n=1 Tax=Arctium lappa TaxID=4217 RepID=A0ACB9BBN6_ARCLA|nr:hypothetical protein L6452_20845 [Arctium lappa]
MGNALRITHGLCCSKPPPTTTTGGGTGDQELGHHDVSTSTVGVSALAQHLYHFEITSQVPGGLSKHVTSSKKAQSNWYKKLAKAWRESKPPPKTPEEASRLVIHTLHKHQTTDLEVLSLLFSQISLKPNLFQVLTPMGLEKLTHLGNATLVKKGPGGFTFTTRSQPLGGFYSITDPLRSNLCKDL